MNVIYNYENQHDIHSAKELFQSISSQFHF